MANWGQNSDYAQLRDTIRKKDKVRARNLILNNVDVNNPKSKFNTPLHWAITQFEDLEIMTMLLDRGANVHAKNQHNLKPLDVAIQNDKTAAALLLIKKGALFGEDLNKLLLQVIEKNNHIIVKNVIDYGIQYNTSINFNILFNAGISRGYGKTLEHILPHCQFLKVSDKYIPKEIVINSGQQYKECVELLLKWNFIINPISNQDEDFIYGAVENGHLQIVLQLLKLGINVNLVNSKTRINLLKIACFNKHHEIVENLLKHNASVNETTPTNAEIFNDLSIYSCNSSLSSSFNEYNLCGLTCLHIAVLNSDPIMTRLLLEYGATIVDDPTFFNITSIAVRNNCKEIVCMFLDHSVDINEIDPRGRSLLHFCINTSGNARDTRYKIVKLLLERGLTIRIQSPGNKLLFKAVKHGHRKIAQLFLDYNADIQYISPDGDTLLHKAIEKEFDVEFIKTLLNLNSPVDAVNNDMLTPLLVACKTKSKNQFEIIKALLDHNANVNSAAKIPMSQNLVNFIFYNKSRMIFNVFHGKDQTPLHFISKYKSDMTANIIDLLLEYNANIEAVDARGWTPLFIACENDNDIAVKCLLDHHANTDHMDLENLTPLYIAAKHCGYNSEVIKLLLEHKANVHCIDNQGNSIIHLIVENRNAELIKNLARTQKNFNPINKNGDTPLHIAIIKQSIETIETLIKYGVNVNILDKKKRTPLQSAMRQISILQNKLEEDRDNRDSYWGHRYYGDDSDEDGYDTDCYESDANICKKMIKILKIHIVKLKAAELKVNTQNLDLVYHSDDHYHNAFPDHNDMDYEIDALQFEVQCEQEIEKMRMESIGVNNMTFYDLLKKNIHFLSRYVKNKKVRQVLDLEFYDEKFPLYIDIVRSRFRDAKFRYRLMNSAKKYFSMNICSQLMDDCVDTVFSFLNIKEIKMFIRAMKLLD